MPHISGINKQSTYASRPTAPPLKHIPRCSRNGYAALGKVMDSSRWSDGQIELFHALGKVCERVGQEGADELLRGSSNATALNGLDGRGFVAELNELRERVGLVDDLERTNKRLKAELDAAREQLVEAGAARTSLDTKDEVCKGRLPLVESGTTLDELDDEGPDRMVSYERIMQQHNFLIRNYQELVLARSQLEDKLRSSRKSNLEWVEYANALEKKIERLQEKLVRQGIPSMRRSGGISDERTPPEIPSSSRELVPIETRETGLETLRRELPNIQHMSERISELARNAAAVTPAYKSPPPPKHLSSRPPDRQQEEIRSKDIPRMPLANPVQPGLDLGASDIEGSERQTKLSVDAIPDLYYGSKQPASLASRDSVSTEEVQEVQDVLPRLPSQEQFDIPPLIIKEEEPSSDSPIIVSCRNVKKRKVRHDPGVIESASYTKVKIEPVTSSPIGLAGLKSLFPQESMDLDEIGEKMNTPKKRRLAPLRPSNDDLTPYKYLPAKLHQGSDLADESRGRSNGNPLALQLASSNKQITSYIAGQKRDTKRRQHDELISGAVILGEDDENDAIYRTQFNTEIQVDDIRKPSATATELQRRLSGLLEEPCPKKELLTPSRPLNFPAATAQPRARARATPTGKCENLTPSSGLQINATTTPNTFSLSSEEYKRGHKPSTAKKRTARTPQNIQALQGEDSGQEPFRTKPLHRLSLEHFKVNPDFNQGSDYAFTDVVRGRELRKCLPGCTKPECCGDKFRKFVEFARAHEHLTLSQEEEDERLLEDYMGDNKSRLRNMAKEEREELLIQARTRDLANKTSKHRHAYERRQTPPGFWRSDFPSTQELQIDRQEAANREKELVQQRYQEAMRPGGRWLFRDE